MSLTIKSGGTTVYSLPDISGNDGDFLTSGGQAAAATWNPISIPAGRVPGEIIMWKWDVSENVVGSSVYKPLDPNNTSEIIDNWYLCNGATVNSETLPNITSSRIVVGIDTTDTTATCGTGPTSKGRSLEEDIPYIYHTHNYKGAQGKYNSNTSYNTHHAGNHTHTFTKTLLYGFQNRYYKDENGSNNEILQSWQGANSTITYADQGGSHNHTYKFQTGGTYVSASTAAGVNGEKYTYQTIYYIIYLPDS